MKICHVAHGAAKIPPDGWGAIEASIWDFKHWCEYFGHQFYIVNTKDKNRIVSEVNRYKPDVVHIHCEFYFSLAPQLDARVKIIASQWPRLFQKGNEFEASAYLGGKSHVFCVSEYVKQRCLAIGVHPKRLLLSRNGARSEFFKYEKEPIYRDRAICLGAVNSRKRQYLIQEMDFVDFAGPIRPEKNPEFETHPRYLGEWPKQKVYSHLTDYASLVLLSTSEAAPLATCEGLMAGLGVVVSENAAMNLDLSKPFIQVVPEAKIADREYLSRVILKNIETSRTMRDEIRLYARENFDWKAIVQEYITNVGALNGATDC